MNAQSNSSGSFFWYGPDPLIAGLQDQIEIDSVGTHSYHVGLLADECTRGVALSRGHGAKVAPMVDYCELIEVDEVPDCYYGGEQGFHEVIDLLEDGCFNLLKRCASI